MVDPGPHGTGLALVTHPGIASALLVQARAILSDPMPGITVLEVGACNDDTRREVAAGLADARGEAGLLILTDLPGATPANLALKAAGDDCHVLGGLNLAMLIRAWSYRDRPVAELARLALEGGRKALLELQP
jgi:mannose/fructose-specific phosphotransferase system component IIA